MKIFISIASIWSILDLEDLDDVEISYMEPNDAQIVSIIFLLGLDCEEGFWSNKKSFFGLADRNRFSNQLIQVLTGEGKSIIMGFMSTILALIGYEVHSVCYSSYLSERDYNSFRPVFDFLGL